MTKSELIDMLAGKRKLSQEKAERIVNAIFVSMADALQHGERIEVRGFGCFEMRSYDGYVGRNPRTGAYVQVMPKRLPFFRVGKDLQERVNKGAR